MWAGKVYDEWDCDGAKCFGMRDNKNKAGIVRSVWPNGTVEETTFHNNFIHGLRRLISGNEVIIELFTEGIDYSQMRF